jgi:acetoin utilization protein AcuB
METVSERIGQEMTEAPRTAPKSLGVEEAWKLLRDGGFRHLPVVEEGRVVGVVSERDLRQAVAVSDRASLRLGDVMTAQPYCVASDAPLVEVVREMARKKYGCAIVLGRKGEVAGIFTRRDAMWILVGLLEKEPQEQVRVGAIEKYLFPNYLV